LLEKLNGEEGKKTANFSKKLAAFRVRTKLAKKFFFIDLN